MGVESRSGHAKRMRRQPLRTASTCGRVMNCFERDVLTHPLPTVFNGAAATTELELGGFNPKDAHVIRLCVRARERGHSF